MEQTPCFLRWALEHSRSFASRIYQPVPGLLSVSFSLKRLVVWNEWFLRYAPMN